MDAHSFDGHSRTNRTDGIMTAKENCRIVVDDAVMIAGRTRTEIDLKDRVIRKTWKLMGFARSRTDDLDNHVAVQIKDKSTILEGYTITLFEVYLTSRGKKMRILSTADLNEARLIRSQITEFLKESAIKCLTKMNTTASGASMA